MRVPMSWLREFVQIPAGKTAADVAEILTSVGFEDEGVTQFGADIAGPIVVGRVVEFVEEPQANGKTIRWCQVEVAPGEITGIVCGARNFFVDDKVVVVRPGATLPGGFQISARKTYGHVSDGMICSARELALGDDHDGIVRLATLGLDPAVGSDAIELLGLVDEVIEVVVLPDRGYAMSMRGMARELAAATGWAWTDPTAVSAPVANTPDSITAVLDDPTAAERMVFRTLAGLDPAAPSPAWMQRRLFLSGVRSISLAVDVTNYVMLELGQPLHAFDADKLQGTIRLRRAGAGATMETLDHVVRQLDPSDLVIADDSGPIALAGVMGGAATEISDSTKRIVLEAIRFNAGDLARTSRQQKLSSEASRRLERGVDPELQPIATARAVALLSEFGGAREVGAVEIDNRKPATVIELAPNYAAELVGADYSAAEAKTALETVGCKVSGTDTWQVTVPSWRPDLVHRADLAEEVARICGYDRIPSVVPIAPASNGLSEWQRNRRTTAQLLAGLGLVEVLSYPFVGQQELDDLLIPADDPRRLAVELANPLNAAQSFMRTSLLPPLLSTARRNLGRGHTNVALFELGSVTLLDGALGSGALPAVGQRPAAEALDQLNQSVPAQPVYAAAVMTGEVERGDSLGSTRHWDWSEAVAVAAQIGASYRVNLSPVSAAEAPWHPGRCAALLAGANVVGFAGELHPRVCERLGLPARTVALELDLTALAAFAGAQVTAQPIATFPHALVDVALLVDTEVAAESLRRSLLDHAGELVESVTLFDVYTGDQVPAGKKSLAFSLEFRAADRTLTDAEVLTARNAAVAAAAAEFGATQR